MGKRPSRLAKLAAGLQGAMAAPFPAAPIHPQLPMLVDTPPAGDSWLHEIKFDGYRQLSGVENGAVQIWSRNALSWTKRLPAIAAAIGKLPVVSVVLDGELIAGQGTRDDFGLLQRVLSGKSRAPLAYVIFDLLYVDGVSLMRTPQIERKQLLQELATGLPAGLAYSSHVIGNAEAAFALAAEHGFEGIVSKRLDRSYTPGRGRDWVKSKLVDTEEYAVVGYTPASNSRTGFSSLLLATPTPEGWVYAGRVGTGFTDALMRSLWPLLANAGGSPPVAVAGERASLRSARWFPPRFVVEVYSRGRGNKGVLRQPSFKRVRPDKLPDDL